MKHPVWFSRSAIWIPGLSLIWAALLAFDRIPQLRGDYGWRWPYDPVLDLTRLAPLLLGVVLYTPVALWLRRRPSSRALLAWVILGGAGLSLAAVYVRGDVYYRLYAITVSNLTGGWHPAATRIRDLSETLRQWPRFMSDSQPISSHLAISPPGMVVLYYAASAMLENFPAAADWLGRPLRLLLCDNFLLMKDTHAQLASAWLGMLMPLWGSLTVLPLYHLGRRVFGSTAARWSAVWWPLIPSFLIFAPLPSTFYPLPALALIILLWSGLRRNQPVLMVAAGLVMSGLTFLTFTFAPLLLLAGFLTLGYYGLKTHSRASALPWHWPLRMGLWFGLGLSLVWLLYFVLTGVGVWDILWTASQLHLELDRPYGPWLILHLNDFFMFTGWPLVLLAAVGVMPVGRKLLRRMALDEGDILMVAAVLTVVVLDISGALRGESGRILLFLSPLLLLAAAHALGDDRRLGEMLTMTQAIIAVVMVVCLHVLDSEFKPPPPPPALVPVSDHPATPSGVSFEQLARLDAFSGHVETRRGVDGREQATLVLWLSWAPQGQFDRPYYLSLIPVAPDGQAAPVATLLQPFQQLYPTTCWKASDGELQDRIEVPLFKSADGDWWVSLSLIDGQSGQKVGVINADGSRDHQIGLGPFR